MKKLLLISIMLISIPSYAALCTKHLAEPGNYFEVSCVGNRLDINGQVDPEFLIGCSVSGYMTDNKFKDFDKALAWFTKDKNGQLHIKVYRKASKVEHPLAYLKAMNIAEQILLKERYTKTVYLDANSAKFTKEPTFKDICK